MRYLIFLSFLLPGCVFAGDIPRDELILPIAKKVYRLTDDYIDRGIADGLQDGDLLPAAADTLTASNDALRVAFDTEERARVIAIDWQSLVPWATRGVTDMIDDGKISEGAATSLYQRIVNWRDAMAMLEEREGFDMTLRAHKPLNPRTELGIL